MSGDLIGVALDVGIVGLGLLFATTAIGAGARYGERRFSTVGLAGVLLAGAGAIDLAVSGGALTGDATITAQELVRLLVLGGLIALLLGVTLPRTRPPPGS